MKRTIKILLFILISGFTHSQVDTTAAVLETESYDTLVTFGWGKERALENIENDNLEILVPGGFGGSIIYNEDSGFERKYKVKFIYQGCVQSSIEKQIEYNKTIFAHLDKMHGKSWRNEIRKDLVGL